MSFKGKIEDVLVTLEKRYTEYCQLIDNIYERVELSTAGKEQEAEKLRADKWAYWSRVENEITETAASIAEKANSEEAAELSRKAHSGDYAAVLSHTIEMLPHVLNEGDIDTNILKERLEMFENDPFAIACIKSVLDSCAEKATEKGGSMFGAFVALPADHRGEKAETVTKLVNTVSAHIRKAFENMTRGGEHNISLPAEIRSTLDYVEHCNDDCTEYDEAARWAAHAEANAQAAAQLFQGAQG